jgi:hypothetical protein
MRPPGGGYTLIEVMLFLAISLAILVTSIVVVGGQEAHAEFSTSMNEINGKVQQWIDEVANGYSANGSSNSSAIGNYTCSLGTVEKQNNTPVLSLSPSGGNARGANPECIFLGKVIQINNQDQYSDSIYAYTMLGRRTSVDTDGFEDQD